MIDPGVPEPVDPASLRRLARVSMVLVALVAVGNVLSRWGMGAGGDPDAYDVFLALNLPAHAVSLGCLISISASSGRVEELGGRLRLLFASLAWTVTIGSWIVGGPAVMLNLAFATMLVGIVRLYLGGALGLWALLSVIGCDAAGAALRLSGALPARSPLPDVYLLDDGGRAVMMVGWHAVLLGAFFTLAAYAANRYRQSEHQLRTLNGELEHRVARQVAELERANRLRRYLSPQLVEELLAADEDPAALRDRRPITVMFADLRGFTGLVERMEPDALAALLNTYFDEVTQVAFRHGGTVDKFIGDAIMVVFGAPRATGEADQARRCVRMAVEIQRRVAVLRVECATLGAAALDVRIGIGSGQATVGTFGAAHRADYTAVGAPVNRAARLEPLAPGGGILIDARTRELLDDDALLEAFGEVALKGFARPESAYRVIDGN